MYSAPTLPSLVLDLELDLSSTQTLNRRIINVAHDARVGGIEAIPLSDQSVGGQQSGCYGICCATNKDFLFLSRIEPLSENGVA